MSGNKQNEFLSEQTKIKVLGTGNENGFKFVMTFKKCTPKV